MSTLLPLAAAWLPGKRIGRLSTTEVRHRLFPSTPLVEYNGQVAVGSGFPPFRLRFRIGGSHEGGQKFQGKSVAPIACTTVVKYR